MLALSNTVSLVTLAFGSLDGVERTRASADNREVVVLRVALDTNCWIDAARSGSQAFGALQRILKARQVGEATGVAQALQLVDGVYQSVTDPRRLVVLRRTKLRTEACSPIDPGMAP